MESILIQRCPREIATYALARLRLACMPGLVQAAQSDSAFDRAEAGTLVSWAKTQAGGCSSMMKVLEMEKLPGSLRALAAGASLRYYRNRSDSNPIVKTQWTQDGLAVAATMTCGQFLEYPTSGNTWARKYRTVFNLVDHNARIPIAEMTDDEAYQSLLSLSGIGPQSASMISLFWLDRAEPILDEYLQRVLKAWEMLPAGSTGKSRGGSEELREHLRRGAGVVADSVPGWTPQRVLACIYLWCCEIGRFRLGGVGEASGGSK